MEHIATQITELAIKTPIHKTELLIIQDSDGFDVDIKIKRISNRRYICTIEKRDYYTNIFSVCGFRNLTKNAITYLKENL